MEEDEDTEKIDCEVTSDPDPLQAAENDNKVNGEMLKRKPETMTTIPETKTISAAPPESPKAASQTYSQPQVEVINAGDERQTQACPGEALFLTPSAEEEERPKARVAFADPTLRSNPSTPVRPAAASAPVRAETGPSEEEMTLSSLGPEETQETSPVIETKETKKVTEPPKDALINSPEQKVEPPKTENQLPTLGKITFDDFEILI